MRTRKRKPHIALILSVSLMWLIFSANATASDWFVRPAGGSYGTEDGTSYANAWDGLMNVNWADISAGDTLYLCGAHINTYNSGELGTDYYFTPGATGTEADPITIKGYPGDPAIIWNAYIDGRNNGIVPGNWTGPVDGVYYNETGVYAKIFTDSGLYENINGASYDKYTKLDSAQEVTDYGGTGVYYTEAFGTNQHKIWLKPFEPSTFKENIRFSGYGGYCLQLGDGKNYIEYQDIDFMGGKILDTGTYHHYTFTNCSFLSYGALYIYDPTDSNYITFDDCEFAYAGNGIYVIWDKGVNHHMYVQNSYFHDIGNPFLDGTADGHAIGIQNNEYFYISGNTFERCGSAIVFHVGETKTQKHCHVTGNLITDMRSSYGKVTHGYGIVFQGNNDCPKGNTEDMIIASNIIASIEGVGITTTRKDFVEIYNNVVYDCAFNYRIVGNRAEGASVKFYNNISSYPSTGTNHVYFNQNYNPISYDFEADNNIYYPDAEVAGAFYFLVAGFARTAATFTEWKSYHADEGDTVDNNSILDDPDFLSPGSNFKLLAGSPAIDAGVDVGLTEDFEGNPVPQGPAPDIGAYESVIDPDNPPPVLQAIGDKSVDENVILTFDVSATDPDGDPITYSVQYLPSGATFSGQTFSWTPSYDQAGSYQVRFIASDGNSNDSETITITVNNVNRAPVLGPVGNQSVDENTLLSFSVGATDADGDAITYSISGLPTGAVFTSQTFTWTPSYDQAGTHSVTFTADDGQAQDSEMITITVINVNRAPVLAAIGNKLAYADVLLTFTIDATDPDDDAITYSAGTLPSGATFTGQDFDWTPSQGQGGSYTVTFTASDGQLQDSETVSITVGVDSLAPTVTDSLPTAGSIQVPLNNLITLNIADAGIGVDASLVTIQVNNNIVYTGDTSHYISMGGNCRRLGTKADYQFVYQSNEVFDYDQTLTLTVNATDLVGNAMDEHSYSFVTQMRSFGQNKQVSSGLDNLNSGGPATVCDTDGNIWAVWHAGPAGSRNIYVAKLAAGADAFGTSVQIRSNSSDQANPAVALGTDDKLYVVWQDNREGDWDIYGSTSTGGTTWSVEQRLVDSDDNYNQTNPALEVDSQSPNRAHVVWQEGGAGDRNIYIATSSNNFVTNTVTQITFDTFDQVEPAVVADSDNTVYVVWTDGRNGSNDIYGAASNNPWTNVAIVSNVNNQSSPAIAAESAGSILHLLWIDDTFGDNDIYYASSDGLPGSPLTGSSIIDDSSGADQLDPTIAVTGITDNNLKVFACWQDWRNTDTDLYFAELSAGSGTNVFVGDDGSNAYQGEPAIGIDEYDHPYIMWADNRSTNTDIYYAGSTFIEPVALASELVSASASSSTIVGTDPQAITTVDDVSIVVPAGACSYDVTITLTKIANLPAFTAPCLGGYDFGPSGIQFSQSVTITIPYVFSGSDGSAKPYWFSSLTGTLSQQGITDIQDIVINPTLHALSFKTTHFTAFYLFAGGGGAAAIIGGGGGGGGCSVSASGEGNIVEYILPYIGLAVVMVMLKMRDSRYRKARNMTTGKC